MVWDWKIKEIVMRGVTLPDSTTNLRVCVLRYADRHIDVRRGYGAGWEQELLYRLVEIHWTTDRKYQTIRAFFFLIYFA